MKLPKYQNSNMWSWTVPSINSPTLYSTTTCHNGSTHRTVREESSGRTL